jgi:hypothetical protein
MVKGRDDTAQEFEFEFERKVVAREQRSFPQSETAKNHRFVKNNKSTKAVFKSAVAPFWKAAPLQPRARSFGTRPKRSEASAQRTQPQTDKNRSDASLPQGQRRGFDSSPHPHPA